MKNKCKLKGDVLELYGKPLEEIPIKSASTEQTKQIVDLVDAMQNDGINSNLLQSIDNIVYDIYGLSEIEKRIVEDEFHS